MSREVALIAGGIFAVALLIGIRMALMEARLQDLETELYNLQHPPTKIKKEQA